MSELDKMAANAGKDFIDTTAVGKAVDKSGGTAPATEMSGADAAIMKQKAIDAAQAKGG